MKDLIKVNYANERQTVLGRDLHKFLEIETPYHIWFPRMLEYGFIESVDYIAIEQKCSKPLGGRPSIDHQLTIGMAKEIAMIQRNEKGKQARQYFIECETKLFKLTKEKLTIEHQKKCMETLYNLFPELAKKDKINYIKANTITNKAVSNAFGFDKMLKKDNMTKDMLELREKVLDDYIKLYEITQDTTIIKTLLYAKYTQKLLQ